MPFLILLSVYAAACGAPDATARVAQRAVADFHDQYNARRFAAIYNSADSDFKRSGTYTSFNALMHALHATLGKVRSTQNQSIKLLKDDGQTMSLQQKTTFDNGVGFETFLFGLKNGEAVLTGYKMSSRDIKY